MSMRMIMWLGYRDARYNIHNNHNNLPPECLLSQPFKVFIAFTRYSKPVSTDPDGKLHVVSSADSRMTPIPLPHTILIPLPYRDRTKSARNIPLHTRDRGYFFGGLSYRSIKMVCHNNTVVSHQMEITL